MTKIYYGCDEIKAGWSRYFDLANCFEIRHTVKTPSIKTLNRWRVDSPKGFAFVIHARPELGRHFADASSRGSGEFTPEMAEEWAATCDRSHAAAAKAILLQTPAEFSPSQHSRRLIDTFAEHIKASSPKACVIWEPMGIWTREETLSISAKHGLIPVMDPFMMERDEIAFSGSDACWLLTERAASRRHFDQFDMEQVLDWAGTYDRVFVLFRGRFKRKHLQEFSHVVKPLG
jgi:uncharacterized protein YecE (DUF72 family)